MTLQTRQWLVFFSLLAGCPFFFFGGPDYHAARSFSAAWDLGHILFFTLVSWLLCIRLLPRAVDKKISVLFLQVFLAVFCIGLGVELVQMILGNRYPGISDILRNQLGCLVAIAFFCPIRSTVRRQFRFLFQLIVVVFLFFAVWPLTRAIIDEKIARQQFPVLSDFETPFERWRWHNINQLQIDETVVRHGRKSVKIQLTTATYSGASLFYFANDWRKFNWLHFSVYNPDLAPLALHCRIHDVHHAEHGQIFADRFHKRFLLQTGWNDIEISLAEIKSSPAGRVMDMQQIEGFGIFVVRQSQPLIIFLDHVYLRR